MRARQGEKIIFILDKLIFQEIILNDQSEI